MVDQLNWGLSGRALEILLRLPPLYLMDAILLQEMSLTAPLFGMDGHGSNGGVGADYSSKAATLTTQEGHKVRVTEAPREANFSLNLESALSELSPSLQDGSQSQALEEVYFKLYGSTADAAVLPYYLANLLLGSTVYLLAAFILTLSLRQLLVFYGYLLAVVCLPLSYLSHAIMAETLGQLSAMKDVSSGDPSNAEWFLHRLLSSSTMASSLSLDARAIVANYLVQTTLGLVLASVLKLHFSNRDLLAKVVTLSMLSPNVFAVLRVPPPVLDMTVFLSLIVPLMLTVVALGSVAGHAIQAVVNMYRRKRQLIHNFGLNVFLETEWNRLRVPSLLRTFWVTRIGLHLFLECINSAQVPAMLPALPVLWSGSVTVGRRLVSRGAETIIAILGMTSVVSSVCHYVGSFFHAVLTANTLEMEDQEEKSIASVSAVLFFVLALQTGLTSLEPEKRFSRLCKNLCLLLTALFHFIHNMVSPVLMSLSASHNYNSRRHVRALFICAFLVLAPVALMTYLWQVFNVGTWLLAVSAFCVEVVVKVAVTVSVYLLFLYDQHYKDGMWEFLDDAVYYVKATGNSVEFCFAVFLFFNGGWILIFESGGTIRAIMMLIHAYCNIWLEARSGWQTFIKRRTAVAKINSLPDASDEELRQHNDVCAICYQEMTSTAKVTRCRHFFHGVCLRKWLYVQDSCPLCHGALYNKSSLSSASGSVPNNNNNNNNNVENDQHDHDQQQQQQRHADEDYEASEGNDGAGGGDEEELAESEVDEEIIDNDDADADDASSTASSSSTSASTFSGSSSSLSSASSSESSVSPGLGSRGRRGSFKDGVVEVVGYIEVDEDDIIYDSLTEDDDEEYVSDT